MANNVSVKITADVSQLNAQLAIARAQFSATQKALNDLAKDAAKNGMSDALKADMAKASEAMLQAKNNVAALNSQMRDLQPPPKDFRSRLEQALDVGIFLEFKALASEALRSMEEAFEATIEKAKEFGIENQKFGAQLGISTKDAAALGAALTGVGASTDEYAGMALKLERQLKTQEKALNSLGMATRDSNGQLLNGKELMDSAISTMGQYKAGTDQNEFALLAFGKGAQDVYNIMRVSQAAQEQYASDMQRLGVATGSNATEASIKFEEALARQKQQIKDVEIALGQHLMPVVTQFLEQLNDSGADKSAENFLEGLAEAYMKTGAYVAVALTGISAAARETTDILVGTAKVSWDIATMNFTAASKAGADAWAHMKADASNAKNQIHDILLALDADIVRFETGLAGGAKAPPSGNKNFVAPASDKQANDARRLADELISIDANMRQKRIEGEATTNSFLYEMGERTLNEFVAQAKKLEDERYQIELDGLGKKETADRGDAGQFAKDKAQEAVLEQEHQNRLTQIDQQAAQKKRQIGQTELQDFIHDNQEKLQSEIETLDNQLKNGQITFVKEHDLEVALTRAVQAEVLRRFDAENAGLKQGTEAYAKAMKDRAALIAVFDRTVQKADDKLVTEQMQKWKTLSGSIFGSMNSALHGVIFEGQTAGQFLGNIAEGIADAFLQMGEKILEDQAEAWLEQEIMGKASSSTMAVGDITASAARAAAAAFASTAAIPGVGPEMAPAAASAAYAEVMAMEGLVAFAKGTNELPADMIAQLHAGERIVPAADNAALMRAVTATERIDQDFSARLGQVMQPVSLSVPPAVARHQDMSAMRAAAVAPVRDGSGGSRQIFQPRVNVTMNVTTGNDPKGWMQSPQGKQAVIDLVSSGLRAGMRPKSGWGR